MLLGFDVRVRRGDRASAAAFFAAASGSCADATPAATTSAAPTNESLASRRPRLPAAGLARRQLHGHVRDVGLNAEARVEELLDLLRLELAGPRRRRSA